jgi:MSHA type pilus biogenesis protein MshL
MKIQHKKFAVVLRVTLLSSCIFLLSCAEFNKGRDQERLKDIIDPNLGLTREQFKNGLTGVNGDKSKNTKASSAEPSIPEASEILATPPAPEALPDKLISLSVTEDVPLKDVLMELSRLAEIDMEIDPGISGGIILRVKDRPFKDVLERVVALGGLRYNSKNGVMRVERDFPYQEIYKVDFLNITRSNDSTTSVDTKGLSSSDTSSTSSATGTSSTITNKSTDDVWESVEKALKNILSFTEAANSTSTTGASTASANSTDNLQINKPAGVISVIATQKQHQSIKNYLDSVKEQVSSQVLIEAKIVEVTLDDEYKSGIDWGTLSDRNLGLKITGKFTGDISSSADFLTIGAVSGSGGNLSSAVSFTESFGTSRTLSSPRLNAINNQEAILTFVKNEVYYKLDVTEETDGTGATATTSAKVSSTLKTAPIGVILSIQPSINQETQEITMHVRPTLSVKTGTVRDPAVDITVAKINQTATTQQTIDSSIPEIETKSLDSILKIHSGEVMVIGGLMKDTNTNTDKGVPFLNRTPMFGNLFKSKVQTNSTVETIIFIKATIVPTRGVAEADKKIYKTYMKNDPHPLAF